METDFNDLGFGLAKEGCDNVNVIISSDTNGGTHSGDEGRGTIRVSVGVEVGMNADKELNGLVGKGIGDSGGNGEEKTVTEGHVSSEAFRAFK